MPESGHKLIQSYVSKLGHAPGVYRMLDEQARVLYVGKARNLKIRVSHYTRPNQNSSRISRMISETTSMMFLTTKTETEALLLEQNLIKQLKPKYNVLLRDDKSFPYIFISTTHEFPRLEKHRGAKKRRGRYYGPFANTAAVNETLNTLQKIFLLRTCSDKEVRAGDRPCLNYHLKRCSGPCGGKISKDDYTVLVQAADDFLNGKSTRVQKTLAKQMLAASNALEFEKAAELRDRIRALTQTQTKQGINPKVVSEADIIAIYLEGGQACVQVFFIRANQNWGNRDFYLHAGEDNSYNEVLEAFLGQFYSNKEPPKEVVLSHKIENADIMEEFLSSKLKRKVRISVPERGEKRDLVMDALRNAKESLARKLVEKKTQIKLMNSMAKTFDFKSPLKRIEVYDNSHIQGAYAIGAMIVVGKEGFVKGSYRKFNIKGDDLTPGDDFGMMREVLSRRFKRLLKESLVNQKDKWPDLLLIDGGAGQVSAAAAILKHLDIYDVQLIGIAKGPDRKQGNEVLHLANKSRICLKKNDPVLYFIQRMRDEAHRFAIGAHRKKRSKSMSLSLLDDIKGVGRSRKRALLAHFGSAKAVSNANVTDLKAVHGVSYALAEKIYDFFHE